MNFGDFLAFAIDFKTEIFLWDDLGEKNVEINWVYVILPFLQSRFQKMSNRFLKIPRNENPRNIPSPPPIDDATDVIS